MSISKNSSTINLKIKIRKKYLEEKPNQKISKKIKRKANQFLSICISNSADLSFDEIFQSLIQSVESPEKAKYLFCICTKYILEKNEKETESVSQVEENQTMDFSQGIF